LTWCPVFDSIAKVDREAFYRELGRRVSTRRSGLKRTQAEIAETIGASRAWIANIEAGRQRVQVHQLYALAGALGCTQLDELISTEVPEVDREDFVGDEAISHAQRAQIESLVLNAVAAGRPRKQRS
jgi:transcriptional regulator with XRE-family HTH domain